MTAITMRTAINKELETLSARGIKDLKGALKTLNSSERILLKKLDTIQDSDLQKNYEKIVRSLHEKIVTKTKSRFDGTWFRSLQNSVRSLIGFENVSSTKELARAIYTKNKPEASGVKKEDLLQTLSNFKAALDSPIGLSEIQNGITIAENLIKQFYCYASDLPAEIIASLKDLKDQVMINQMDEVLNGGFGTYNNIDNTFIESLKSQIENIYNHIKDDNEFDEDLPFERQEYIDQKVMQ